MKEYHNGKIKRNEIVLCELSFERGKGKKKEIIILPRVIYKYIDGTFSSKRLLLPFKITEPVKVLDINVTVSLGFGVDETK